MGYTRINWEDSPSTATPINAINLNHMEDGIVDAQGLIISAKTSDKTIADAADGNILSLLINGKLEQEAGASPSNPKQILAWNGTIQMTDGEKISAADLETSLYGIPVNNGGNYTDKNGQKWLCDKLDLDAGVIHRYIGRSTPIYQGINSTMTYGAFVYCNSTVALTNNSEKMIYHPKYVAISNDDKTKSENLQKHRCYIENKRFVFRYPAGVELNKAIFDADVAGTICVYALDVPFDEPITNSAISQMKELKTFKNNTSIEFGMLDPFFELTYATNSDGGSVIADMNSKIPFRFGIDSEGNYGYYKVGADTLIPFSATLNRFMIKVVNTGDTTSAIGALDMRTMTDDSADFQHVATHHFSDLFDITYATSVSQYYTMHFHQDATVYLKLLSTSALSVFNVAAGDSLNIFKYNSAEGYLFADFVSDKPKEDPALTFSPISSDPIPETEADYYGRS